MVQISHIVKKWREGVEDDLSTELTESNESGKVKFEREARRLLKKISSRKDEERKTSREKFSDLLSQLVEEQEETKEAPPIKVQESIPAPLKNFTEPSVEKESSGSFVPAKEKVEEVKKIKEVEETEVEEDEEEDEDSDSFDGLDDSDFEEEEDDDDDDEQEKVEQEDSISSDGEDPWDQDVQDFTQGLFEEDSAAPLSTPAPISTPTHTKKKEESSPIKVVKKNASSEEGSSNRRPYRSRRSNSSENSSPEKNETNRDEGSSGHSENLVAEDSYSIENVIKSMKSSDNKDRSSDRHGKRRRESHRRKDNKKGNRHKWI